MKCHTAVAALGLSLCIMPWTAALAAEAYVTANVNLRAGPDSGYPSIALMRPGMAVMVNGCVDGWAWCDVSYGDDHGWVSGAFLQEEYDGERLGILGYGQRIGIPILTFELGPYWDDHYRSRPWYGKRAQWSHIRPQYRAIEPHRDPHGGAREDSHNYEHGDVHGTARASGDTELLESHGNVSPHASEPLSSRPSTVQTEHNRRREPHAAAASDQNGPSAARNTGSTPRSGKPPSNETRSTAAYPQSSPHYSDDVSQAHVNAEAAAAATRPIAQAQPRTPRPIAEHKAPSVQTETPAKAQEHERDNNDR